MGNKYRNKNYKKYIKIFFPVLFIFIFLVFILNKKAFLTSETLKILRPNKIFMSIKNIYSNTLKDEIAEFVSQNFEKKTLDNLNLSGFDVNLKEKFSIIKKIEWDFTCPGSARLDLVLKKPVFSLNDSHIVTKYKDLFDKNFFQDYKFTCTRYLYAQVKDISDKSFRFLRNMPDYFWLKYRLKYQGKNKMEFLPISKKLPVDYSILSRRKKYVDKDLFGLVNQLFKKLYANKKLFINKKYVLDLRFDNRIILRRTNKERIVGGNNGKKNI